MDNLWFDDYVIYDPKYQSGLLFAERTQPFTQIPRLNNPRKTLIDRKAAFVISHEHKTIDLIAADKPERRVSLWHPSVKAACKAFIEYDVAYANYHLFSSARLLGRSKNHQWNSAFTKSLTVSQFLLMGDYPSSFVHGTDYESGLEILHNGLLPRSETERGAVYGTHVADSLADRIYLYGNAGHAALAAYQVTTHGSRQQNLKALILQITIPDKNMLRPDEDAIYANNWIESLWTLGSVAYLGGISPQYIKPMLQLDIQGKHKEFRGRTFSVFKLGQWRPVVES